MNIVGFGDYLIHFSPHDNERFLQADLMALTFTGAEANVCAALAFWGENVRFVTKLPEHHLSRKGVMFLQSFGIRTDFIAYGPGRMGLYFLEKGHDLRPSSVIYDRADSAFTASGFSDYDWEGILEGADAFCLSGITPSLSGSLLRCCENALRLARQKNIPVFYDVNLRPTLCGIEQSWEIFRALSPYITHLISNEEHLKQLLDFSPRGNRRPGTAGSAFLPCLFRHRNSPHRHYRPQNHQRPPDVRLRLLLQRRQRSSQPAV